MPENNASHHLGFDLAQTYIHLDTNNNARPIEVDNQFWSEIGQRQDLNTGRLVSVFHSTETWSQWEMHPAGDEIVYLHNTKNVLLHIISDGKISSVRLIDFTPYKAAFSATEQIEFQLITSEDLLIW